MDELAILRPHAPTTILPGLSTSSGCCPRKRTFALMMGMSALCQKQTFCDARDASACDLINSIIDQTAIGNVIPKRMVRRQMKAGRPLSWAGVPLTL